MERARELKNASSKGEGAQRVIRLAFEKIKSLQAELDTARARAHGADQRLASVESAADRMQVRRTSIRVSAKCLTITDSHDCAVAKLPR